MEQGTLAFGLVGGADWGVAFEGLPQMRHCTLRSACISVMIK